MDGYSKASASREPQKALQCNAHFCCTGINLKDNNSPCDSQYSMLYTTVSVFLLKLEKKSNDDGNGVILFVSMMLMFPLMLY